MAKFRSVEELVKQLRPVDPVYCYRKDSIKSATNWFNANFPGKVLYAVKCNPNEKVLKTIISCGIDNFDTASLEEIKLIKKLSINARIYFMHTIKNSKSIGEAYFKYNVRDFAFDSKDELDKILQSTNNAKDLNLFLRLQTSNEHAEIDLSKKFGATVNEATHLIKLAQSYAKKLAVSFHVGSQCMNPISYLKAIKDIGLLIKRTGITPDIINVGGGFPTTYPELYTQPLKHYINDGTYGSLFDAGQPKFIFPSKAIQPDKNFTKRIIPYSFFGPTCDGLDYMKGPFNLPSNIKQGDYIEIGQLGAYGISMRTKFNGFYSSDIHEVEDNPIMSIYNADENNNIKTLFA